MTVASAIRPDRVTQRPICAHMATALAKPPSLSDLTMLREHATWNATVG
jgi:hypothetical protein